MCGLLLLIFFGFITNNHPRSNVNTAAFGAISLSRRKKMVLGGKI